MASTVIAQYLSAFFNLTFLVALFLLSFRLDLLEMEGVGKGKSGRRGRRWERGGEGREGK